MNIAFEVYIRVVGFISLIAKTNPIHNLHLNKQVEIFCVAKLLSTGYQPKEHLKKKKKTYISVE